MGAGLTRDKSELHMKGGGAEMVADSVGGLCCAEIQRERQTDSDGG